MLDRNSAVVLFSGGQDSTTCLYWAKKNFQKVLAVCVFYGQRHSKEIELARELAYEAEVNFHLIDASFIGKISTNSLTNLDVPVNEEKGSNSFPNTFVPGRNLFFLSMAAVVAHSNNCMNIVTGVSQSDYSGYPDCRDNFIRSANVTLNLAMDEQFVIHTPLMWLTKAETWQLSDNLGILDIVQNKTLTCYNGIPAEGCGECPACKLRRKGLIEFLSKKI
jgi:7-cyano-7-deazaguanine synthase